MRRDATRTGRARAARACRARPRRREALAQRIADEGSSNYHTIKLQGGSSTEASGVGPYVTSMGEDAPPPVAREALERAGFRWIDHELGATIVTGLCVYYFGHRDPLSVRTLLFYWQD